MPRVKPKQSVPLRRSKRLQNKADARNLEAQSNWVDVKGNDEDFNWEEFVREGLEAELSDKNESEKRRWFNRSFLKCVHRRTSKIGLQHLQCWKMDWKRSTLR